MKNTRTTIIGLLIVFSSITHGNSIDSISISTYSKIVSIAENSYKLVYQAREPKDVIINIADDQGTQIYNETIKQSSRINKIFDLENLQDGDYTMSIKTPGYLYEEKITIDRLAGFDFRLSKVEEKSVVLIGLQPENKQAIVYILDDKRNILHKQTFKPGTALKNFNLEAIDGKSVFFLFYHNGSLIKEEQVEI